MLIIRVISDTLRQNQEMCHSHLLQKLCLLLVKLFLRNRASIEETLELQDPRTRITVTLCQIYRSSASLGLRPNTAEIKRFRCLEDDVVPRRRPGRRRYCSLPKLLQYWHPILVESL